MNELLDTLRAPVLTTATVVTGLQAGLYYAFSVGVMPGLAHVDDGAFVSSMRQINLSIVNPAFLLTFLGAPAVTVAAIVVSGSPARPWVIAGAVLALATVVVTGAGNIALNDALQTAGHGSDPAKVAAAREAFESSWVRLNLVRVATSTAALGCLAWGSTR